jgi:hypothetical protein
MDAECLPGREGGLVEAIRCVGVVLLVGQEGPREELEGSIGFRPHVAALALTALGEELA